MALELQFFGELYDTFMIMVGRVKCWFVQCRPIRRIPFQNKSYVVIPNREQAQRSKTTPTALAAQIKAFHAVISL